MPTVYLLVAMLLCILFYFLIPVVYILPVPWNLLGIIPLILGIWINISADRAFKLAETTVKPFEESSILIQEGVFRWTRNPMYLGFVGILLGISMLLRSLSPYIVIIVFIILIDLVFIRVEEEMLEAKFMEEWKVYRSKVREWI